MSRLHAFLLTFCMFALMPATSSANSHDEDSLSSIAQHMHAHLDRITAIKSAIIAGKLEDTRGPARWLAGHEQVEGLPPVWEPFVARMRRHAADVVAADSLESAALSVSRMAATCGRCHRASGTAVAFGYDEPPETGRTSVTANMLRHLWAADRMWEGLIGPSDAAWTRGTSILADVSLEAADVAGDTPDAASPALGGMLGDVRTLGVRGGKAVSPEARSALYGEFLSQCAYCHVLTSGGPER